VASDIRSVGRTRRGLPATWAQPTATGIVLSWDIALSEKEAADYSACVVLLNRGDSYYVLDVIRGKFPFNKLIDKIIEVKERYGKAASLVIEDGGIS
jgi:phage terminase large subunit-like protein